MEQPKKLKIRIVATLPKEKPLFACYGCSSQSRSPCHYEGDPDTHWCKCCFVTEEMIEESKKNMPSWQDLLKPKPKPKIKIVKKLPIS